MGNCCFKMGIASGEMPLLRLAAAPMFYRNQNSDTTCNLHEQFTTLRKAYPRSFQGWNYIAMRVYSAYERTWKRWAHPLVATDGLITVGFESWLVEGLIGSKRVDKKKKKEQFTAPWSYAPL